jgi:hypothetical protein
MEPRGRRGRGPNERTGVWPAWRFLGAAQELLDDPSAPNARPQLIYLLGGYPFATFGLLFARAKLFVN